MLDFRRWSYDLRAQSCTKIRTSLSCKKAESKHEQSKASTASPIFTCSGSWPLPLVCSCFPSASRSSSTSFLN